MSGKTTKKVLCVIMSVILVTSCIIPAFAADNKCSRDDTPLLIISGFSQYQLIDKRTGKSVWTPDEELILNAIEKALPALETLLASDMTKNDFDVFCDDFIPAANELFSYISCTPDGEPYDQNVGLINQFTGPVSDYDYAEVKQVFENDIVDIAVEAYGADHVWVYGLDWRVDPLILADDIHDYIETMKATTGHDKVAISGISMGGCILSAYLSKYGYDDLSNITMLSSAFTGIEMVGALLCGEVEIDEQGLYNMINESIGKDTLSEVIAKTGILDKLLPVVDELIAYEKDRIYSECLIPSFGYITGIWAFVPDSRYSEAKEYMNIRMNEGTDEQNEIFWKRVDAYHYGVQNKIADILTTAQDNGVCVSIVSNYNSQMPPITTAGNYTGDQVIETIHTSGFATVAPYGETLDENYMRNAHLSSDRMIDASTCILPDNTWFIKNQRHVEFSNKGENDNSRFFAWILTAPADTNVNSNPDFPQFMQYDRDTLTLSPLSSKMGDINASGNITVADAKLVLKAIAGAEELTDAQAWVADINIDGKISVVDAKLILKMLVS